MPLFIGFQPSKVVQDFFHPQYHSQYDMGNNMGPSYFDIFRILHTDLPPEDRLPFLFQASLEGEKKDSGDQSLDLPKSRLVMAEFSSMV